MLANLKHYPQLNFLDFRFIFVESYATSYDGKHALSDANILKALFFLDVLFKLPLHQEDSLPVANTNTSY